MIPFGIRKILKMVYYRDPKTPKILDMKKDNLRHKMKNVVYN